MRECCFMLYVEIFQIYSAHGKQKWKKTCFGKFILLYDDDVITNSNNSLIIVLQYYY